MRLYKKYEAGKTDEDYYHHYELKIPWDLWWVLKKASEDKGMFPSQLVRGIVYKALKEEGYDLTTFENNWLTI